MNNKEEGFCATELIISVNADQFQAFFQLLQQGIILKAEVGRSVRSFLYRQLQLSYEFVEDRVQTIFLDGKPVDDLDAAFVEDGSTLALSAAMPGLVGATMRRGGYYASLRSQISHGSETETAHAAGEGFVTLKLFNLVAKHVGRDLLQKGVLVNRENLEDLLSRQPDLGPEAIEATRDGMPLDWDTFRTTGLSDELVHVRCKPRDSISHRAVE